MNSKVKFPWETAGRRVIFGITILCMVVPLVLFLLFSLGSQKAGMRAEAEVLAYMITGRINESPEYWKYEDIRLISILQQRRDNSDVQEHRQLFDSSLNLVAEDRMPLLSPAISVDVQVYDAGQPAGFLRVSRSIRATLLTAVGLFAACCACGTLVYFMLHTFPLKVMRSAYAALYREKEQASVTLSSITDAVITTNSSLLIRSLNPAAEQFGGVSAEKAAGKPLGDYFRIIHPATRQSMSSLLTECVLSEENSGRLREQVVLVRQTDGQEYQAEMTVVPLCDEQAMLLGLVIVFHDVTESRALEEKLREKMLELVHIVRYAGVGIAFVRAGIVQKINSAAAEILGLPQEQIVGKEATEILKTCLGHTGDVYEIYDQLGKGETIDMEHQVIRADGKQIWMRLIGQGIIPDQLRESGTVWVAQDITKIKLQQEQMEMARLHAEEASRFKSELIAHVSHELRSPLSGIIGMNRMVLGSELDALQRQYLNIVDDSAGTLLQLINNLLDLSKIESGVMELEEKTFRITAVQEYIQNTVALRMKEKGLTLSFLIADDVPDILIGDELRLGQVLLNLVVNGVKFTSSGSVKVICDTVSHIDSDIQLRFRVIDSGCGIDASAREKIFEAFVQSSRSVARTHGGSGLGLSIAKKIIRLMGGEIWVDSTPGVGTTFLFTAWFKTEEQVIAARESAVRQLEKLPEEGVPQSRRILLVEDLPMNQTLVKLLLEQEKHTVQIANNGREALVALKETTFDVIFMDVQMPVMDGLIATRLIRRCETEKNPLAREDNDLIKAVAAKIGGSHIPIIGMTGNAMEEGKNDCFAAGMDSYISKPFEIRDVFQALEKVSTMPKTAPTITVDPADTVLFERRSLRT